MDNFTKNLNLKIIDEIIDEKSNENEGFIIDSDEKAEWALKKIAEETLEMDRYVSVCRSIISEYEGKIRKSQEKLKNKNSFLENQLQRYFESVVHKKSKTQEIYNLPSGTLKLKFQNPEFKKDDIALVKWLKDNSMNDYVKIEEKPNWVELKKVIKISGEKIINEDGQIVEGVEVIDKSPIFEIEV